jgi:hypothetical protein
VAKPSPLSSVGIAFVGLSLSSPALFSPLYLPHSISSPSPWLFYATLLSPSKESYCGPRNSGTHHRIIFLSVFLLSVVALRCTERHIILSMAFLRSLKDVLTQLASQLTN